MERVFTLVWILLTTYPALCTDVSTIDDLHGQIGSMLSNEPEKAMALAQQALDLSRQKHYTYGEGISLFFLGYLYDASGHKSKSLLSFLRSKKALSGSSDERALKQWLTVTANIGKLLHDHGKYQEAIDFYQEGIAVASQKGYQRRAAIFHYRQGNAERKLGYLDESITTLRIALKIFKEIRDEKWILNSYNILGLTLKDWQEYDRARAYHHQVLNFRYDKVDANYYLGRAYQNLADTYLEEKRFQEALQVLNKALAYKELGKSKNSLFLVLMDLAETHRKVGDLTAAKRIGDRAMLLYTEEPLKAENIKLLHTMSTIALQQKDLEAARYFSDRYQDEHDRYEEHQKELIRIRDNFKIHLVLASFHQEEQYERRMALLRQSLWAIGVLLVATLILLPAYYSYRKRKLQLSLERGLIELGVGTMKS